ncbi:hypothetical protein O4H48_21015 [Rhodobacteraceae bacterium G21628-S1]|nr:hypothetical protein [Rhodobacteraceae bacterium G21628-S1]
MSLFKKALIGLCGVLILQIVVAGFIFVPRLLNPEPSIAVFDPERSLVMFVEWSSDKISDDDFTTILPVFQQNLQVEIDRYSHATGQLVVRKGAILTSQAAVATDATETIMSGVLQDAAR